MSKHPRPVFSEHDAEPVPGLPGALPTGETILWQGSPRWTGVALRAMHLRALAVYFAILAAWRAAALTSDGASAMEAASGASLLVALGAVVIGLLAGYAWLSARSTLYTITSRRIVVRTGVALPLTVNLPYAVVGSADAACYPDGTGDISLKVMAPHRVSWVALWPHTRSWRLTRPEPSLRAVAQPQAVAQVLGRALAAAASTPVRAMAPASAKRPADQAAQAMA